ncbi:ubiquinone/menaquinone biosynthesis methyltransferase [Thermotomaculum hydrothermale]|uniref:Ubiquinone/menaquinone biosynthesis methyltransferase n=1 Tax=Thermotomaculum hydrothermale TaxID=981385 RepID=A0A7R6PNF6_9BACT|nr:class I SAM-dependent methyltransferase [Thermotomaculum hydrothermale]BBB33292.1 ubiquinone/menaquinone biosynthesis methyltransferase [Thermotomaculum hydrothermale]
MARTKIEVKGFEARFYDYLMNLITLGYYPYFINSAIKSLPVKDNFLILDAGAGTGRNASLISKQAEDIKIVCMDIGKEFLKQLAKKSEKNKSLLPVKASLKSFLPFRANSFDMTFMCFVLHGFEHEERLFVLKEFYRILKPGGYFCLIDYNDEINLKKASIITKIGFYLECDLASEFITHNWEKELSKIGFKNFNYKFYFGKKVRLTICQKED